MPIHLDSFNTNLHLHLDDDPKLNGLGEFKRCLERAYFSKVTIRNCSPDNSQGRLVVEMECNFDLVEVLFHLQKGIWGDTKITRQTDYKAVSFTKAFTRLQSRNNMAIDVEEFALFLNDSSIVIKKIYASSIEDQLGNILNTIAENYVHFTRGLSETPFEIYIPVFEDGRWEKNIPTLSKIKTEDNCKVDYFNFWGLYFDSEDDAVIYDLSKKSIISGDLYLLNH